MSELRKPVFTFLLKNQGNKSNKVEIFNAIDFEKNLNERDVINDKKIGNCYRLRVNGKWYPYGKGKTYYWKSEIRDLIFKSIQF